MNDDQRACYAAFKAKDVRFDGRFFVGVASTGIYCRPVCRARLPKPENCSFYPSAAAAEQAGFRPCLLCRPELAPGNAPLDAAAALALRAARLLEDHCASEHRVDELAQRLGCSDRHLRRVFAAAYHVTPIQYLQTCRLLLAKQLMDDADIDPARPRYFVANPANIAALLNTTEVKSSDYNTVKALAMGQIDSFLGFKFIMSNLLPADPTETDSTNCYAFAQDAIVLAVSEEPTVKITERADKNYANQVYVEMSIGATRLEGPAVVEMNNKTV